MVLMRRRMVSCGPAPSGHPVLGLVGICILVGRPIDNRPQVANLPHIKPRAKLDQHRCPVMGKASGIGMVSCGGLSTRLPRTCRYAAQELRTGWPRKSVPGDQKQLFSASVRETLQGFSAPRSVKHPPIGHHRFLNFPCAIILFSKSVGDLCRYGSNLRDLWSRPPIRKPYQPRPQCDEAPLEPQFAIGSRID